MKKMNMNCPNDKSEMVISREMKKGNFRGVELTYHIEQFVCPTCSFKVGTIEQAAAVQKTIADAYRAKVGLLTSTQISEARRRKNLSQEKLAMLMGIGIASVKRWEGAAIQSRSMDKMLRNALEGNFCGDLCTGNRTLSVARIKLVLQYLEGTLKRQILKENDKMLYASKYLWFIDMLSFRELGQSITGSSYAKLPLGPQLNNYRDLVGKILNADTSKADPISDDEKMIIQKVAHAFPTNQGVFHAAHREMSWKEKADGELMYYSDALRLTEI